MFSLFSFPIYLLLETVGNQNMCLMDFWFKLAWSILFVGGSFCFLFLWFYFVLGFDLDCCLRGVDI